MAVGAFKFRGLKAMGALRLRMRDSIKLNFPEVSAEIGALIFAADVGDLRRLQIEGRITSVDIVSFYAYRCFDIGRKFGFITEEYYAEAMVMAKLRDA